MFLGELTVLLLVLLPGIIMVLVSMRRSEAVERGKRLNAFVSLTLNLFAILGFLTSLYVKPAFAALNIQHALPSLTRFVLNPWFDNVCMLLTMLALCAALMAFRRLLHRRSGFSMITIASVITALCMWILGDVFRYGLAGRVLAGGHVLGKMLIPLHSLLAFSFFFAILTGLYARHIRQPRSLWLFSIVLIFFGLCAYHAFAWYLPTFPLSR